MSDDSMWRRPDGQVPPPEVVLPPTAPAPVFDPLAPITAEVPVIGDPTPTEGVPRPARAGRRRRRWLRRTLIGVGAFVGLCLLYYGVTLYQVWATGRSDQLRTVDAIVVMGAAQYDGRPSPLLKARLDHALELFREDLAPVIVVTGGKRPGDRFTEAYASRKYLRSKGVPDSAILAESDGSSTWESFDGVAALLDKRLKNTPSILIVTDPFHSLRSRLIAQDHGLRAYTSATDTSPWGAGTQFRKSLKEAAGIAIGRIIGLDHI